MALKDVERLKDWVGRTSEGEDLVTQRMIDGFRATLAPYLAPVETGEAPLGFHWCLAPAIASIQELGPDGHPAKGKLMVPVPLPRRMWAGGEIETLSRIRIGDRVTRTSTIESITTKEGRSGSLCFVIVRHEIATQHGIAVRERQDIVYREAPPKNPPASKAALQDRPDERKAERSWSVEASPTLLFRYSALTFNGHRIHYDFPYATGAEGYPGLVVHGPLQATFLFNLAAIVAAQVPTCFRFRGLAPLIAGQIFTVHADVSGKYWTQDSVGRVCMEGY